MTDRFPPFSGKKGKKSKEKKLSLQDFLMTTPSSGGTQQVAVQKVSSWAEECDDNDDYGMGRTEFIELPTAPRAARMQDDDSIPHTGPFSAKVSNLKYDLSEQDVDEFFMEREIRIKEMRLARDDQGERLRGYGHIEFESRQDLLSALMLPDPIIHGRPFRIELAGENDQRDGRTVRKRYDNYVARDDKNESTNWRDRKESTFETVSDRGDRRGGERDRGGYQNRSSFQNRHDNNNNDNGNDDGGNWRLGERANQSPPPERRRFNDRRDDDRGDRRGGARDRYERRDRFEPEEERPVLNLAPRTKPLPVLTFPKEEEIERPPRKVTSLNGDAENHNDSGLPEDEDQAPPPPRPKPTPVPSANIFGQAKPVDTAARERAIEEKLQQEREAKIRAEKEAREQERLAAENAQDVEPKKDVIVIRTEKSRMQEEAVNWRKHDEPTSDSGSVDGGRNRDNGKRFIDGDRRRREFDNKIKMIRRF